MHTEDHKEMKLLKDPALKEKPFKVPEGYFDGFADRLKEVRKQHESGSVPTRQIPGRQVRIRRIAIAAAIAGLVLMSWPLSRILLPSASDTYLEELALMEGSGLYYNYYALASDLYEEEELDDEEAFASLASDYLALGSQSLDLYLEIE